MSVDRLSLIARERRWFIAVDALDGSTWDVADSRSAPIDGLEFVEVAPASQLAGAVDTLRYIAGDDVAGFEGHWTPERLARKALANLGVEPYADRGQS